MVARSAGDDLHVAHTLQQLVGVDAEDVRQDVVVRDAALERVGDRLRLLVNFLEHVVAIFAALDRVRPKMRLLDRALRGRAVLVVDLHAVDGRVGDVTLGEVDEAPRHGSSAWMSEAINCSPSARPTTIGLPRRAPITRPGSRVEIAAIAYAPRRRASALRTASSRLVPAEW